MLGPRWAFHWWFPLGDSFVTGVFAGSALWWLLLCFAVGSVRERVSPQALRWINRVSGVILAGFGLAVLLRPAQ